MANGGITGILNYWADIGVFSYVLPFLLVFAVVYGILSKTRILGGQKGVDAVVSIALGLLALQFDYVPAFFATIFPYAGIGISILLVLLILMGLFGTGDDGRLEAWAKYAFFGGGLLIALVVIFASLKDFSWTGFNWWNDFGPALITLVVLGVLVWAVIGFPRQRRERDGGGNGGGNN